MASKRSGGSSRRSSSTDPSSRTTSVNADDRNIMDMPLDSKSSIESLHKYVMQWPEEYMPFALLFHIRHNIFMLSSDKDPGTQSFLNMASSAITSLISPQRYVKTNGDFQLEYNKLNDYESSLTLDAMTILFGETPDVNIMELTTKVGLCELIARRLFSSKDDLQLFIIGNTHSLKLENWVIADEEVAKIRRTIISRITPKLWEKFCDDLYVAFVNHRVALDANIRKERCGVDGEVQFELKIRNDDSSFLPALMDFEQALNVRKNIISKSNPNLSNLKIRNVRVMSINQNKSLTAVRQVKTVVFVKISNLTSQDADLLFKAFNEDDPSTSSYVTTPLYVNERQVNVNWYFGRKVRSGFMGSDPGIDVSYTGVISVIRDSVEDYITNIVCPINRV